MASRHLCLLLLLTACVQSVPGLPDAGGFRDAQFADPPMEYRPVPLWFWNNTTVDKEGVSSQLNQIVRRDGYGGCAILPFGPDFRPDYLGEEYMDLYAHAVAVADSLGAQMSLYDEYGFPSGSMGFSNADGVPRFQIAHPGKTIKRLDKHEIPVGCGRTLELDLGAFDGKLMAVAAYDAAGSRSESLRGYVTDGKLVWTAPGTGDWKVMMFECVVDGKPRLDYLDPEGVGLFIRDVHEKYYSVLGPQFGSVITTTFFDEPTMYYAQGRMWTERFNEEFEARYGMEPDAFYPALWYDIGEETAAARNMMFGLHSALYAEGFMKTVAEWAEAHGIRSTGHQDQEEVANTTCISGDLMLDCKYMSVPGIDKIGGDRPAELYYKVVSSAARNWDKAEVMSETFGAMGNIPVGEMYRTAIEQYTKGITNLIPHAVWYDDTKVTFPPELSWRNPLYSDSLPAFNGFLSRMRYMLARPGRHVADIAVLYPVQTQYAGHHLDGELGPVAGGVRIDGTDYPEVARILTDSIGRDFTFLHPEVLDGNCTVSSGRLRLNNKVDSEDFSTLILPGVKAIGLGNMKQVVKAWRKGVLIVFTTQIPSESADYGVPGTVMEKMAAHILSHSHGRRRAVFIQKPTMSSIAAAISGGDPDVSFLEPSEPFNYLHKVCSSDGCDINVYLFGNIDSTTRRQTISLKGEYDSVRIMNPHTGSCCDAVASTSGGRTTLTIGLQPAESLFVVCR